MGLLFQIIIKNRFLQQCLLILLSFSLFSTLSAKNTNDAFNQVNALRQAVKMIPLTYSSTLSRAAQNHANYLSKNIGSNFNGIDLHSENKARAGYTGSDVTARSQKAGYPHKDVKENISVGSKNIADSVSGLMSGIYHRFTFLDFVIDNIGYGTAADKKGYKSFVYNMGRKDIEKLCATRPKQAKPKKPIDCLGTTVSAEYINKACANLPQAARYEEPFSQRCANGRLLKSRYMNRVCNAQPTESIFSGEGSYFSICQPTIRVNASWFNQLCNSHSSPALHSGDNKYYEICDNKTRVYSSWLKNYCDSATPLDQATKSAYYSKPCHSNFRVSQTFSNSLETKQAKNNPKYVIWPSYKAKEILPVFYDETPDPLPDLDISGYPLSLQFNPKKVRSVSVKDFKLEKKTKAGRWKQIKSIRKLNHQTDPHKIFTKQQFAWYPLKRLDWNTNYRASVYAKFNGTKKKINWQFKTQSIKTPLIKIKPRKKNVKVPEGKWFTLYLVPSKRVSRPMQKINLEWRGSIKVKSEIIDMNTIKLLLKNTRCRPVRLNMAQGRELVLNTCMR